MRSHSGRIIVAILCAVLLSVALAPTTFALGCPWRCREGIDDMGRNFAECRNIGNGDMTDCYPEYDCIGEVCDVWCAGQDCFWA